MRRAVHLLIPLCAGIVLCGVDATAHPATPRVTSPDATSVLPPARARWKTRDGRRIRVFVRPASGMVGWRPELAQVVWASFDRWTAAGIPVRFARSRTAATADVVVEWVERLPGTCIGKTWRQAADAEITAARITLALQDHRGRLLSPDIQRGAVLHEIGHLLGLEHAHERNSIMYPQVWVTEVSEGDRWALRALYTPRQGAGAE